MNHTYEVTLGSVNLDTLKTQNGFATVRASCNISGKITDNNNNEIDREFALISFLYKPATFRFNYYVGLKASRHQDGTKDPFFLLSLATLEEAAEDDYDKLDALPGGLHDADNLLYGVHEAELALHAAHSAHKLLALKGAGALAVKSGAAALVGGPVTHWIVCRRIGCSCLQQHCIQRHA